MAKKEKERNSFRSELDWVLENLVPQNLHKKRFEKNIPLFFEARTVFSIGFSCPEQMNPSLSFEGRREGEETIRQF